jgi:hypothetical protein
MIIRISKKAKPEETRKALDKLARASKRKAKKLSDFYGKKKGMYGNPIQYQKIMRNEWT